MYERFSVLARQAMQQVVHEAQLRNYQHIGTNLILLSLIGQEDCIAIKVLRDSEVDLDKLRQALGDLLPSDSYQNERIKSQLSPRAKLVLEHALAESGKLGDPYVGTQHLLLGLLSEPEGGACQVLNNLGVTLGTAREDILKLGLDEAE